MYDNFKTYFEAILSQPFTRKNEIPSLKNYSFLKPRKKPCTNSTEPPKNVINFKLPTPIKFPNPEAGSIAKIARGTCMLYKVILQTFESVDEW